MLTNFLSNGSKNFHIDREIELFALILLKTCIQKSDCKSKGKKSVPRTEFLKLPTRPNLINRLTNNQTGPRRAAQNRWKASKVLKYLDRTVLLNILTRGRKLLLPSGLILRVRFLTFNLNYLNPRILNFL